jgi:hypothetical protein
MGRSRRGRNVATVRAAQRRAQNWQSKPWYKTAHGLTVAATAAGVVIGILTLAFTGVTTIFQAWVASDQLQQSKEDVRRAERAQASRITFWTDTDAHGAQRLHLKNGSVDPVSDVILAVRAMMEAMGDSRFSEALYIAVFPGLAPCSELVIDEWRLSHLPPPGTELEVFGVAFTDTNGTEWLRTPTGLGPEPERDPTGRPWWHPVTGESRGVLKWPPAVKPVTPCR